MYSRINIIINSKNSEYTQQVYGYTHQYDDNDRNIESPDEVGVIP